MFLCYRIFKANFSILTIHTLSLGSCEVPQKIGPDRFSCFDVVIGYKQKQKTIKQTSKVYIEYFNLHCKTMNKSSRILQKMSWFFLFYENQILLEANFWNFDHPWAFPWVMWGLTKNLGPIGPDVLTFIGYRQTTKQTPKQTNRQPKYIYRWYLFKYILSLCRVLKTFDKREASVPLTNKLERHSLVKIKLK